MDFTSTMLGWTNEIPTGLLAALHFVGLLGLCGWMYWRAGSGHVFWVRAWRVVHGRRKVKDLTIGSWITERTALMQFRIHTGIPVRTYAEAAKLIAWAKRHDEKMGAKCRWLFDIRTPTLKQPAPRPKHAVWPVLLTAAFLTGTGWAALVALSPRAWVSVKNGSGTTILLSPDGPQRLLSTQTFDRSDCRIGTHADNRFPRGLARSGSHEHVGMAHRSAAK